MRNAYFVLFIFYQYKTRTHYPACADSLSKLTTEFPQKNEAARKRVSDTLRDICKVCDLKQYEVISNLID